jgi:hypothetical protein
VLAQCLQMTVLLRSLPWAHRRSDSDSLSSQY